MIKEKKKSSSRRIVESSSRHDCPLCKEYFIPNEVTREAIGAMHIASAAIAGMDILLTWNCKHMANPHTLPKTRAIVSAAGYVCPAVMTPETFIKNTQLEV